MKKLLIVLAVIVGLGFYTNAFAELQVIDGPITAQSVTVNGQITIKGGSPGAGKVLTSDATGLATWQTSASSGIGGSGTTNYFPLFTGTGSIGNSVVYQSGTNVGVGTTGPAYKLDVAGDGRFTNSLSLTSSMDQLKFEVPAAYRYWFMSKPSINYAFGWYSPDELGWLMYLKTGTGDLILPGSNKLGIGTASPLGRLQLGGSNYETNLLLLGSFNETYVKAGRLGAIYPYVIDTRLVADNSGWGFGWTHEDVTTANKYTMMYLSPEGQFGSNYRLWLDGYIALGNISKDYSSISGGMPAMTPNIKLDPAGISYINGGNVGIGTTSPSSTLDVAGGFEADGNTLYVAASLDRVGVGTTSPTVKLDVVGDIKSNGAYVLKSGDNVILTPYYQCNSPCNSNDTYYCFCGINPGETCQGQITTSSTCYYTKYYSSGTQCRGQTASCTYRYDQVVKQ